MTNILVLSDKRVTFTFKMGCLKIKSKHFVTIACSCLIGLTPSIALIYISVEPAVTQNCVASVTKHVLVRNDRHSPDQWVILTLPPLGFKQ